VLVLGSIAVVLDYLFSPVLTLMSLCRGDPKRKVQMKRFFVEDGTLGYRTAANTESIQSEPKPAAQNLF